MNDQDRTRITAALATMIAEAPDPVEYDDLSVVATVQHAPKRRRSAVAAVSIGFAVVFLAGVAVFLATTGDTRPVTATTVAAAWPQWLSDFADAGLADTSAHQEEILSDRHVSFDEYERSVEATLACARRNGLETTGPTLESDGYTLSYLYRGMTTDGTLMPDSEVFARFDPCYNEYSSLVETIWTGQHSIIDAPPDIKTHYVQCFAEYGFVVEADANIVEFSKLIQENPVLKQCREDLGTGE